MEAGRMKVSKVIGCVVWGLLAGPGPWVAVGFGGAILHHELNCPTWAGILLLLPAFIQVLAIFFLLNSITEYE
jgi:hypothetical protein